MRFFLGLVGEILQIAFAGRALGCDDRSLDPVATRRLNDVRAKIGCRADDDNAGSGLWQDLRPLKADEGKARGAESPSRRAVASVIHIPGLTPRAFAGWLGTAFVLAVERSCCAASP